MALFGSDKTDHPMEDIKVAKKLLSELPPFDSAKALDEVTYWLNSVGRTEGFKLDYRFELIDLLDHTARNHQRKLSHEYLATDRQDKFRENKLWTTIFEFWKTLGDGYVQCVEQFQSGANGSGAVKKNLSTIIARALRALTLQLKWALLRYGPVDDRVWGELARMYHFAETKGMANMAIEIYPGAHGHGTVQQEFLKALMLGVSSTDGLTPLKQGIAERTVAHFGNLFTLQSQPASGCNYLFDLSMRKPGVRAPKGVNSNKMTRFFGAGKALTAIGELVGEVKATGSMPSHIDLGGTFENNVVLSVLRHLALYWSDNPPSRSSERRKIATRLTVVHSFRQVLKNISPPVDDNSLDFQSEYRSESWIVENASEGGFGAIIPQVKGDWIKLGSLLGVHTETARFWSAGVVRRLTYDDYQQRRVGIQLLSNAAIPVKLSPAGGASSLNAISDGDPAVLLSTTPDKDDEIALLLRAGSFTPGQALEMNVRDKKYRLMPSRLIEGGDDFDWAKFKIISNADNG